MTKDKALKLALEALEGIHPGNMTPMAEEYWNKAITAIKQALAAPVQVFDHVTAARQGLRDAQNRSREISNLINCGTCGYPLAPEERTSLIERDGVMVKPAPVQEPDWNNRLNDLVDIFKDVDQCGPLLGMGAAPAAQRPWVGLTDEEIEKACVPLGAAMLSFTEVARAIEAKLKEKNT